MLIKNKKSLLVYLLVLGLLTLMVGCNSESSKNASGLTTEEKLEDFEYLYTVMSENYPYLNVNYRMNGVNWLNEKESFRTEIENTNNDIEFQSAIDRIVKRLNNDHTHLLTRNFFSMAHSVYSNPEYVEYNSPWLDVLSEDKVLNYYGFNPVSNIPQQSRPPQSHRPVFNSEIIIPDEVAFLRINRMDQGRIEEDGEGIRNFLMEVKGYDKLIIDIRGNVGGDSTYWMKNVVAPLINDSLSVEYYLFGRGNYARPFYETRGMKLEPLSELDSDMVEKVPEEIKADFDYFGTLNLTIDPLEPVGFQGKIYLLIDDRVYSSAEMFAAFSKDSGFATLVGDRTGGDGIGVDPVLFSLPNSGMVIRYSGLFALNGDGTVHAETGITPHVEVDPRVGTFETDLSIQYVVNEG